MINGTTRPAIPCILTACATQIEIQAPRLEGRVFAACRADTTTSYQPKTALIEGAKRRALNMDDVVARSMTMNRNLIVGTLSLVFFLGGCERKGPAVRMASLFEAASNPAINESIVTHVKAMLDSVARPLTRAESDVTQRDALAHLYETELLRQIAELYQQIRGEIRGFALNVEPSINK
jgi:hypothetical protein